MGCQGSIVFLKTGFLFVVCFSLNNTGCWVSGCGEKRIQLRVGLDGATIGSTTEESESNDVMTSVTAESGFKNMSLLKPCLYSFVHIKWLGWYVLFICECVCAKLFSCGQLFTYRLYPARLFCP